MPDQNKASVEHALIQEIAEPLAALPDDPVAIAADVQFPLVLRGYDRIAVDAYVKRTTQLVAELQATHSPEPAVRRALERVGEQVAGILQRAHEAAEKITERSRAEAEERLERARREASDIAAEGERRVSDLDAETDSLWAERRRIIADVHMLATNLTELADAALERFPADESAERGAPGEMAAPAETTAPEGVFDAQATAVLPTVGVHGEDTVDSAEEDPAAGDSEPGEARQGLAHGDAGANARTGDAEGNSRHAVDG
jgi:F0F1-type ATP synthase membrane subunit b/b'